MGSAANDVVGAISVAVAVSSPHRADAFAACRFAIDRLKEVVPIWKKELGPGGRADWIHPDEVTATGQGPS